MSGGKSTTLDLQGKKRVTRSLGTQCGELLLKGLVLLCTIRGPVVKQGAALFNLLCGSLGVLELILSFEFGLVRLDILADFLEGQSNKRTNEPRFGQQ